MLTGGTVVAARRVESVTSAVRSVGRLDLAGSGARAVERLRVTARGVGERVDGVVSRLGLRGAGCRSFSAETEVLLASGDRVAMRDVVVGDVVWATDPVSGVSGGRAVTAVWPHDDWLVELETSRGVVETTEDHPFWNVTDGEWQESREFDVGDELVTADGAVVTVFGLDVGSWEFGSAFDLTV